MDFRVTPDGRIDWGAGPRRCALGKGGIRQDKREGDGATPVGRFALRRVLYRPDRGPAPETGLPTVPIAATDGWCDDPADPAYNRPVALPYPARHELMWRDDHLYDLVIVIGHNDDPPVAGLGSAVFVHLAGADWGPTEGCVALTRSDLLDLLAVAGPDDHLTVSAG